MEALSKRLKSIKQDTLKLHDSINRIEKSIFREEQTIRESSLKLKLVKAEYGSASDVERVKTKSQIT